ncbi:MAG: M24 family metallopeptidase [Anaerolineae bacterium]|nr:M24 family metallopeptidase [Anaerolineae bacterium]
MTKLDTKLARIQGLLAEQQLDALLLQRVSSFAWATLGAASYVNTATTTGEASLLVTPTDRHLITNNIEAARLERESRLAEQGWQFEVVPWYETPDAVARLASGLRLGADGPFPGAVDLSHQVARMRANLTREEGERFRMLGGLCAEAMERAVRAVRPGQTEYKIAGLLAREAERRGVQAIVNLIATDQRVFAFRHPLPTGKRLERYAMLVLCGRRWGLVCSLTRLVHFGRLPDELRRKAEAVAQVDAALLAATWPGQTLGRAFAAGQAAYAETGFPDEWRLHHQGGPAGYEPREYIATPGSEDVIQTGQAYAWNPSITGTKSEDTVLLGTKGLEVLTAIDGWPVVHSSAGGAEYARPAILEV